MCGGLLFQRRNDSKPYPLLSLRSGKGPAYERWAKVYNLKQMAAALQYLKEAHSGFIADPVGLLRGYLSRFERLAYLEEQRPTVSLPACFGFVLAMHQQELRMCCSMVAEIRGHSAQLLRVERIFKPLLHGLDSALVCCLFVWLYVGSGRRQSSFPKNMVVTDAATAFPLWDKLSRSISPSYRPESVFQIT